jgi:hypothetical protein
LGGGNIDAQVVKLGFARLSSGLPGFVFNRKVDNCVAGKASLPQISRHTLPGANGWRGYPQPGRLFLVYMSRQTTELGYFLDEALLATRNPAVMHFTRSHRQMYPPPVTGHDFSSRMRLCNLAPDCTRLSPDQPASNQLPA